MKGNRLTVSIQQALCLLIGAMACAGGASAAANLGERALMAQGGRAGMHAPREVNFSSDFLSGAASGVDLTAFSNGNPMVAGRHQVDVYVNGAWQGRRDLQFKADDRGHVDACFDLAALEALGVDSESIVRQVEPGMVRGEGECIPVQQRMSNASGAYDSGNLRYDLSIPQVFMRREARGYVNPALWDRGINAGFLGYSVNANDNNTRAGGGGRRRNAYLGLNAGLNLGGWQFRHDSSAVWSESRGGNWQGIASYAQRGIPQLRSMLTLGHSYTSGELFDSIRYRGANLSSDDRMLPDSLRGYAPVVRGIAETNARVEVRQNQQLIYSTTVSPGSFVIEDLYPTGYGGDLDVYVIEADGRRREFKVPFGSVPQMLRAGASRYSLTAGQVRSREVDDDPWLVQATYQRGIGNQLTLYGGSALSEGYLSLLYGIGLTVPVGSFAADVTHARTSFDQAVNGTGASVRLSYSKLIGETGTNLTLAAYRYSTEGFYSLPDALHAREEHGRRFDQGDAPTIRGRQRSQFQLTLNQPLGNRRGALHVTGSVRDYYGRIGTAAQYQVGYNGRWRSMNVGFSALRTRMAGSAQPDTQYLLSMHVPLGHGGRVASLRADVGWRDRSGYESSRLGIVGSAGADGNLSYGVGLSDTRTDGLAATANAEYRSRYVATNASYSQSTSLRQASVGASGSVVVHGGGLTLSPQRGDTMVLIEAPGARDARVSNAPGVRIDGRGYAVVPHVSPYRLNTVTLDPQGMAHDVELESSSQSVAPFVGAISHLRFETRKGRALLIRAHRPEGGNVPFGAQVKDELDQPMGMVGQGGRLYVRSERDQGRLQVEWGAGHDQRCTVEFHVQASLDTTQAGYIPLEAVCR